MRKGRLRSGSNVFEELSPSLSIARSRQCEHVRSIYLTGTPWEKKVPLAKKDCTGSLLARLNDQYTDGSI